MDIKSFGLISLFWLASLFLVLHFTSYRIAMVLGPPSIPQPWEKDYARALIQQGMFEEAGAVLKDIAACRTLDLGTQSEVQLLLGDLCRDRLGQPSRARACYLKVVFMCPASSHAVQARRRLDEMGARSPSGRSDGGSTGPSPGIPGAQGPPGPATGPDHPGNRTVAPR
ncbi:MAG: hypothetical protein HY815_01055 [Candidatus Riflebacteria bacterium]|nr:hypothetical protein [Candidatus Riflebacteria bacterium]